MMKMMKNVIIWRMADCRSSLIRLFLIASAVAFSAAANATNTWYVAKEDVNAADTPVEGRGSEALPFRTIQGALDNASFEAGDIVLVKRGDYDEGERWVGDEENVNHYRTNRVYIAQTVYLRAVDGPEVTRIVGRFGTANSAVGRGGDGIRCVSVASAAAGTVIEGFTFEDGASFQSADGGAWLRRDSNLGGGLFVSGKSKNVYVVGCVFRNCSAALGPAVYGGTIVRCLIDRCQSYRGASALCGTYAFASVATRCSYSSSSVRYMLDSESVAVNCTFHDNSCASIVQDEGVSYNCIFAANKAQDEYPTEELVNSFVSETSTNMAFATGLGDYRLPSDSPAIGKGSTAHRQIMIDLGVPSRYLEKDYNGEMIDWEAESFNPGASQGVATPMTAVVRFGEDTLVNGRIARSGSWIRSERFPNLFEFASADSSRTVYCFEETSGGSSREYLDADGIARVVLPLKSVMPYMEYSPTYAEGEIWVDPTSAGSDVEGNGTEEKPYHTLPYAVAQAGGYTIIHAHPGTYSNGVMRLAEDSAVASRVIVPENVMLKATGSVDETIILGAASDHEFANKYGQGTNAIRCVMLQSGAVVNGFTLTGGRTLMGKGSSDCDGAGVLGADTTAFAMNCVISNNVAGEGGGGACASFVKCRILDNRATEGNGGATYRGGLHQNCLIEGNDATYIVMHANSIYSCTIGSGNTGWSTRWASSTASNDAANGNFRVLNSIVYCPNNDAAIYWNCALANDKITISEENLTKGNSFSTGYEALKLDAENLRPSIDSPVVDRGDDAERGDYFPEADIDGTPRVLNGGRFDIGACEFDWRKEYSKTLGNRVNVTDAAPNVVEVGSSVRIPDGVLNLEWQIGAGWNPMFNVSVTGEGALSIMLDGELFATLDAGAQKFKLPSETGAKRLAFEYSGDGYAELSDFSKNIGLVFSIR